MGHWSCHHRLSVSGFRFPARPCEGDVHVTCLPSHDSRFRTKALRWPPADTELLTSDLRKALGQDHLPQNLGAWKCRFLGSPLHLLNQNFRVGARNLYFGQVSQVIFMYLKDWDSALGHLIIFLGISFLVWKWGNYVLSLLWKKKSTWGKMLKVLHIFIKLIYMYVKLLHVLLSLQSWDQESLKHFSDWNTLKTGKRSECSHLEHVCLPSKRMYEWILPGKIKPEARSLSFLFNILHLMRSVSIIHWVPNMCQGTVPGWV